MKLHFYYLLYTCVYVCVCMYVQVICENTSVWTSWWVGEEVWLQDNGETMGLGVLPGRQKF